MNGLSPLTVLTIACEGVGIGLIGAAALRLVRPRDAVSSFLGGLVVTMASVTTSAVVISFTGGAAGIAVDVVVICLTGLVSLGLGLLLGGSVLRVGRPAGTRCPESSSTSEPTELADLGRKLADTSDELGRLSRELATTSNALTESRHREQAADAARRQLVSWFSRALRTPVARLAETVESEVDDADSERAPGLLRLRTDVHQLTGTMVDLLHLSEIQAGSLGLNPASVALDDLVSDAVAELDAVASDDGVRLSAGRIEAAVVSVDHREMAKVLRELLTNAIRCGGPGSTVSVDTRTDAASAVVSVTDGCGGIPEPDLDSVFEVGWRGTDAEDNGGLGLAIVHGIVRAHHGEVVVHNVPGGCCFEVRLPVTGE